MKVLSTSLTILQRHWTTSERFWSIMAGWAGFPRNRRRNKKRIDWLSPTKKGYKQRQIRNSLWCRWERTWNCSTPWSGGNQINSSWSLYLISFKILKLPSLLRVAVSLVCTRISVTCCFNIIGSWCRKTWWKISYDLCCSIFTQIPRASIGFWWKTKFHRGRVQWTKVLAHR